MGCPDIYFRQMLEMLAYALTVDDLKAILSDTENSITKQYAGLLELDNVKLTFTDEALGLIAKKAHENGTGARGLKSIIEQFMTDLMVEIPADMEVSDVIIDEKDGELTYTKQNNRKIA